MSGRISQSYWNQYRVLPTNTYNRALGNSRNRPRESRGKATKKGQGKIVQLDITSEQIKQMEQPFRARVWDKLKNVVNSPWTLTLISVLTAGLLGGIIGE